MPQVPALQEFRQQLKERERDFVSLLPAHIKPEYFHRAIVTAVQMNPLLLQADRRSLMLACMRAAQDGLIPDGREAVIYVINSKRGKLCLYLPMVDGYRKQVLQSGEVIHFHQEVVYEHDTYDVQLGLDPKIYHKPALKDRGEPVLVYSVAHFKNGFKALEIMTMDDIAKVRSASRAKDAEDGPWTQWFERMCAKSVAKRHARTLPISSEMGGMIARDDNPEGATRMLDTQFRPTTAEAFEQIKALGEPRERREEAADSWQGQEWAKDEQIDDVDPDTGEVQGAD